MTFDPTENEPGIYILAREQRDERRRELRVDTERRNVNVSETWATECLRGSETASKDRGRRKTAPTRPCLAVSLLALPGNAGHYKKTHLDDQIRLDAEKCMDSNGGS